MSEKFTCREIFNPPIAIPAAFFILLAIWLAMRSHFG